VFDRFVSRRASLLLPLLIAACSHERTDFPTLRYAYLPPIRLNVASVVVEQHFLSSGVAPDVTQLDPDPPADALRAMAQDRLKAFGTAGRAVFVIQDASLVRHDDVITGSMRVRLEIYGPENLLAAYVEASTKAEHRGRVGDLRNTLYEMTKSMMEDMNVEFELQVDHNLQDWLVTGGAPPAQVQQTPLENPAAPPAGGLPGNAPPGTVPPTAVPPAGMPPMGGPVQNQPMLQ
jgi:hypothetical protein